MRLMAGYNVNDIHTADVIIFCDNVSSENGRRSDFFELYVHQGQYLQAFSNVQAINSRDTRCG